MVAVIKKINLLNPNIVLALGAGSARGLAHLGFLKAFEEEISIDIMEQEINRHKSYRADLLIRPQVGHIKSTDLDQAREKLIEGWANGEE
ncbi:hypothetical protein MWH28_06080 [Natroniella sulfidigena]|uniref:hypothetical protein n=1 Tax=Natroniella sulfidigena TaxID=723921 RepID=UPI002009EF47|nr:hypothetical protein [Natroniella sulfidigena]MCK8816942.1 hypothetical protein [Natroniella sulfidigena]